MVDIADRFSINTPDVVAERFDGEYVILNLQSGKYFALSGAAPAVWDDVMAGHSPASLATAVGERDPAKSDKISNFLHALIAEALIVSAPGKAPAASPPLSTDILLRGAGDLRFEVFDDMADLILADPIHDADEESGWPVRHRQD